MTTTTRDETLAAPAGEQPARAQAVNKVRARVVTGALAVPAAMALGLSASTSYRFAADRLDITDLVERLTLCATVEAAIIALTLHAWGARSKASAWLAYGLVAVQAIPAFEVSGGAGGVFRIAAGPVLLALLLHKLLGLEVRFSGEASTGLLASAGREVRERLTALLGIGRRGADSAAIARSRAADRAVKLASRRRLGNRAAARLATAIDAAQYGLSQAEAAVAEAAIVARVVRRRSVADLFGIKDRHVWSAQATAANQGPNASRAASGAAPRMRTQGAPGAGQGAIVLPLPRRTRSASESQVPGALDALAGKALELDRANIALGGGPISMRSLQRQLSIGQQRATDLRSWLDQQSAPVAHVNGSTV